jgi:O-acetyl-ADP-ribose deacetylase (regulator of RNase III)
MKIEYKKGDATSPLGEGNKIIVHVCNNIGGWGRGFVTAISSKWKEPEENYRQWYSSKINFALGEVQYVSVEGNIWIANLIGQRDIRSSKDGIPPIRYEAISMGLNSVANKAKEITGTVHMPRIGCGLAGGSWDKMEKIILEELVNKGIAVTVYDL